MLRPILVTCAGPVLAAAGRCVLGALVVVTLLPGAIAFGALTLLVDLAATPFVRLARLRRAAPLPVPAGPRRAASIIVVSWNGRDFLARLLPSLFAEADADGGDHEVIVVDNGSTDGSVAWLASAFPRVRVVALPENRHFVRGTMAGVAVAQRDTLVFLNNDMVVRPGFLRPLLDGFTSPDVFGVAAEVFFADPGKRREETNKTCGTLRGGFVQLAHRMPTEADAALGYTPVFWAGGGSAAFDRAKFLALGGFDATFDPFYLEDVGLSYAAWRRGWHVLFTPRAAVDHEHRGTSRRAFGDEFVDLVIRRNQHLFLLRHVTSPWLTAKYFALLPFGIVQRAAERRPFRSGLRFELRAWARALPRLPVVLWRRSAGRRHHRRSDREVIALANHNRRLAFTRGEHRAGPRLRLLFLLPRLPRLGVDGSWILCNLLRELSRRHEVSVFSLIDRPEEDADAAFLRGFCRRVTTFVRRHDSGAFDPHRLVPRRLRHDYSAPELRAAVQAQLADGDYDVVQVEYVEMAHLASPHVAGVPSIYTCHEPLHVAVRGSRARLAAWFDRARAAWHEARVTAAFSRVVTLTDVDRASLERLVPGLRAHTIPSGIDAEQWFVPPDEPPEPDTIAFVGYFRHEPNVDAARWLVEAILPAVRRVRPEAKVWLIGRDPPPEVAGLGRVPGVEVTGFVPDLLAWLRRAAVVAVPVRLGGGLRGKLLEAWAAGRAVVATSIGAAGGAATDGEHLLVADDAAAFADAVVKVLGDPDLRRRLGTAGRRLVVERYSAAAAARRYEELYAELLGIRIPAAQAGDAPVVEGAP